MVHTPDDNVQNKHNESDDTASGAVLPLGFVLAMCFGGSCRDEAYSISLDGYDVIGDGSGEGESHEGQLEEEGEHFGKW